MMTRLLFVILSVFSIQYLSTASAQAAFFLTGAQLYKANPDGSIIDLNSTYRYETNEFDNGSALTITKGGVSMSSRISFQLITGVSNVFTFSTEEAGGSIDNIGLNLFFSDVDDLLNNSFNPRVISPTPAQNLFAGDLTVTTAITAAVNENEFGFKAAKASNGDLVQVQNYFFQAGGKPFATGVNLFELNGQMVSVTSFSAQNTNGKPSGSFTLSVTATPEPSTIGIGALAFCGLAAWVKKRRGKKLVADRK